MTLRRSHRGDEGAIDLQDVYREPAQVGERRVPGAEVVDATLMPNALSCEMRSTVLAGSRIKVFSVISRQDDGGRARMPPGPR